MLVAELFVILWHAPSAAGAQTVAARRTMDRSGASRTTLFSDYLIAFEITSILLLAAIVGAIALARRVPCGADAVGLHRLQAAAETPVARSESA